MSSSSDIPSPNFLKRRIMKLYPQLQKIEKEIQNISQQIPLNLNKTVLQLRQFSQNIIESDKPSFSSSDSEKIEKQLKELESSLMERIEKKLENSKNDIEIKIDQITQNSSVISDLEIENQIALSYRVYSLEHLIAQQQKRLNNRLNYIEQNLSKISLTSSRDSTNDVIRKVRDNLELNMNQISFIQSKLDDLQANAEKEQNQLEKKG